jgi:membrane-bound serine protease (ClpP class)
MKTPVYRLALLVLILLLLGGKLQAEPNSETVAPKEVKAAVIICKGLIDDGLYKSIKRRTEIALNGGAEYLIYEIGTYGGLLDAGDNISKYFILDVGKRAHTVAYITTEAISAGAMISVSCEDIIMLENTTIGDCAPIQLGAKLEGVEREKAESFVRAAFDRAAEANKYPAVLLRAMVSMQMEVYRVKNLRTGNLEFFDGAKLPTDANEYDLANKELINSKDEILTLTAAKAYEYGIARTQVKNLAGAMDFLAGRDGVKFIGEAALLETNWSEEMVRWVNSPAVMGVLVMIALLALYIELSTPGIGLPGLVAAICFAIIIGSKYLVGLANWVEIALFVVGVLLLLIEIFLLPGFGIAGILGIVFMIAGVFGMLIRNPPDKLPWPETEFDWQLFRSGALGLLIGLLGFVVMAILLSRYIGKIAVLSGLLLSPSAAKRGDEVEASITAPPEVKEQAIKPGNIGEVISRLRPAGKARFGEAIVDVVSAGEFIEIGTKVRITAIYGNRVIVKPLEEQKEV